MRPKKSQISCEHGIHKGRERMWCGFCYDTVYTAQVHVCIPVPLLAAGSSVSVSPNPIRVSFITAAFGVLSIPGIWRTRANAIRQSVDRNIRVSPTLLLRERTASRSESMSRRPRLAGVTPPYTSHPPAAARLCPAATLHAPRRTRKPCESRRRKRPDHRTSKKIADFSPSP